MLYIKVNADIANATVGKRRRESRRNTTKGILLTLSTYCGVENLLKHGLGMSVMQ